MFTLLVTLLACAPEPPPTPAEAPAATPDPAPQAEPAPIAAEDPADRPKGSIGGEPILPDPVVVGAISADAVQTGIQAQMGAINACWETRAKEKEGLAGKVLVKLIIGRDGAVTGATTKSTSLRDPATETCVNEAVGKAKFPPLQDGRLAVVSYPFVFPPG